MTTSREPGAAQVLVFWFGDPGDEGYGRARPQWFVKDPAFDAAIARQFGLVIDAALAGGLNSWRATPAGDLARIIVLDQFTRNVFRDTPGMIAGDALALAAAREMVDAGADRSLPAVQRSFCYLPFEHSENLADQDRSVQLFETLRDDPHAGGTLEWAIRHREVIRRFGRFPHRNEILGRVSSPAEIEFLNQPGSRF